MEMQLPDLGADEVAAEIDVPFELRSDDGDVIWVTITRSGTVEIRAAAPDGDPNMVGKLGTFVIEGLAPAEAQAVAKGFWGRVWSKVKAAAKAVADVFSFDGGPALGKCSFGGSAQVSGGKLTGGMVTVGCSQ